jgi:hypothetical protein
MFRKEKKLPMSSYFIAVLMVLFLMLGTLLSLTTIRLTDAKDELAATRGKYQHCMAELKELEMEMK